MKTQLFFGIVLLMFCFTACENITVDNSNSTLDTMRAQIAPPPAEQPGPASTAAASFESLESKGQTMAVTNFNTEIATARKSGAEWTASPILVAVRFGGESMDCRKKTIDLEAPNGENFNQLKVTITEDGMLDDSFRGSKLLMRLQKKEGLWQIQKANRVWNCYRGHQDYSTEPCN